MNAPVNISKEKLQKARHEKEEPKGGFRPKKAGMRFPILGSIATEVNLQTGAEVYHSEEYYQFDESMRNGFVPDNAGLPDTMENLAVDSISSNMDVLAMFTCAEWNPNVKRAFPNPTQFSVRLKPTVRREYDPNYDPDEEYGVRETTLKGYRPIIAQSPDTFNSLAIDNLSGNPFNISERANANLDIKE